MCNSILNVINPWDVRASLLKETGMATGEVALSTHTHVYTRVKINQHTLPASTIPRNMLPLLSLRIEPTCIWLAIDLEDGSSSVNAYHVITSVFEVGGMRVEVLQFILIPNESRQSHDISCRCCLCEWGLYGSTAI